MFIFREHVGGHQEQDYEIGDDYDAETWFDGGTPITAIGPDGEVYE